MGKFAPAFLVIVAAAASIFLLQQSREEKDRPQQTQNLQSNFFMQGIVSHYFSSPTVTVVEAQQGTYDAAARTLSFDKPYVHQYNGPLLQLTITAKQGEFDEDEQIFQFLSDVRLVFNDTNSAGGRQDKMILETPLLNVDVDLNRIYTTAHAHTFSQWGSVTGNELEADGRTGELTLRNDVKSYFYLAPSWD